MKKLIKYLFTVLLLIGTQLAVKGESCCKNLLNIEFQTTIEPLGGGTLALSFLVNDNLEGSQSVNIDSLWYFVVNNEVLRTL